jgi:hypothetical protein
LSERILTEVRIHRRREKTLAPFNPAKTGY